MIDDESVVGDECHIVSRNGKGPRFDPRFPAELLDEPENLILLCRVHHKMADDQCETYTLEVLKKIKENHENWVSTTLTEGEKLPQMHFRRIKENIPTQLSRLTSGNDILSVISNACAYFFEHDELDSQAEVDLVSSFLQEVQDFGEVSSEFEAGDKVRATYRMSEMLRELEAASFWVFGARETQRLEGGKGQATAWPVSLIRVARTTNPEIKKMSSSEQSE